MIRADRGWSIDQLNFRNVFTSRLTKSSLICKRCPDDDSPHLKTVPSPEPVAHPPDGWLPTPRANRDPLRVGSSRLTPRPPLEDRPMNKVHFDGDRRAANKLRCGSFFTDRIDFLLVAPPFSCRFSSSGRCCSCSLHLPHTIWWFHHHYYLPISRLMIDHQLQIVPSDPAPK